jgi:hypothetical protein
MMKKIIFVIAIIAMTVFTLTLTNVTAAPTEDTVAKTTPGVQQTVNAERWATAHPDKVKGAPEEAQTVRPVNLKGEIVSVTAGAIVINQKDDTLITVTITDETDVRIPGAETDASDPAQGLLVGMKVTVRGVPEEDQSITASRITVVPGKPVKTSHNGTVTAFSEGVSITILTKKGETFTYALDEDTKYLPEDRMEELNVGSLVTVIFSRNVNGQPIVASGIVVHPDGTELPEE